MSSFRDLKKCVRQGFENRPGILPCRTFVFLCVFQKQVITSLHVKKMAKLRCGGRGRGPLLVKKMPKLRRGGRGWGPLDVKKMAKLCRGGRGQGNLCPPADTLS